jgi:outer membrane receptor protein involved in Fe transport
MAGLDIYRDSVDSYRNDFFANGDFRRARIQGPVADDASYVLADAYVQNNRKFGDVWELVAGLRFSASRASADSVQNPETGERMSISDRWSKATGSLRFSRELGSNDNARLFAGVSQGFRAPNLSDLTRFDTARSNEIETPVFGLDPEQFTSYEIGTKFDDGKWTGQVALFYTSIADMIIRTPTGNIIDGDNEITKRNSGDGYVKGVEVQMRYYPTPEWQIFGNLTWLKGEVDTYPDSSTAVVREPIDRQMPARLYLGSRWQQPDDGLWFEATLSIADNQDELSTRDRADTDRIPVGGTPGYTSFSLRGGWRMQDHWRLVLAAENVFDENYRIHGSGLNEPGRNFVLTVIYN